MPTRHVSPSLVSASPSGLPAEIVIPTIGVDLPVLPAKIQASVWDYTTQGVSYLVSSPLPGHVGNSVFYGHDFPNLLGKLPQLKTGAIITIVYPNGARQNFVVQKTSIVGSSATEILKATDTPVLTVFTCTGFLDSQRFVASASLID